jgi:UDPglucose 6-dehydrogenase
VIGVDRDDRVVALVTRGVAPVDEPGLQDLMDMNQGRLSATTDPEAAVLESEVTFVVVPTPSERDGGFSLQLVLEAIESIGRALAHNTAGRHVVVITSTVMPGSTLGPIRDSLERASGQVVGDGVGLCYNPMFIALGSVIDDIIHPDLSLIGESDGASGDLLSGLVGTVVEGKPAVVRMAPVNAELAKLAVNTFVTTKISYANMLAEICDGIPFADVDEVTRAVGLDSRIGSKYLRAATAYGGPCFPRDNEAMAATARLAGCRADLAEATHNVNVRHLARLAERALDSLPAAGRLGILGLSYKPGTSVVMESAGLRLAELVIDGGHRPVVYDPAGLDNARRHLGDRVSYAESAAACIGVADVIVVVSPWEEFRQLSADDFGGAKRRVVIDCWRILDASALGSVADVVHLGIGPTPVRVPS